ncbi:MAG: hypothetical protein Q8Q59_14175 [Luteolibacter sp.]|jgi:predicted nucleic acid-binding protein|nr:hypothetical protein [Luteolibacter sp.]
MSKAALLRAKAADLPEPIATEVLDFLVFVTLRRQFESVASVEISVINLLEIEYDALRRTGNTQAVHDVLDAARQLPLKIHWSHYRS